MAVSGFLGQECAIFEVRVKTVLGSTHVIEQLLFSMFPSIPSFDFDLILGPFWGWVKKHFYIYSFTQTTLIFYVLFNYNFWFWLTFGIFVLGTYWAILWSRKGSVTVLGSSLVVEQLFFYVFFNSIFWFWLEFWGHFDFLGP